jgi:hypothetical protein
VLSISYNRHSQHYLCCFAQSSCHRCGTGSNTTTTGITTGSTTTCSIWILQQQMHFLLVKTISSLLLKSTSEFRSMHSFDRCKNCIAGLCDNKQTSDEQADALVRVFCIF